LASKSKKEPWGPGVGDFRGAGVPSTEIFCTYASFFLRVRKTISLTQVADFLHGVHIPFAYDAYRDRY
jgi:hypothetical protein